MILVADCVHTLDESLCKAESGLSACLSMQNHASVTPLVAIFLREGLHDIAATRSCVDAGVGRLGERAMQADVTERAWHPTLSEATWHSLYSDGNRDAISITTYIDDHDNDDSQVQPQP